MKIETFAVAALVLAGKVYHSDADDHSAAIALICRETGADMDWISHGTWSGDETVASVRAEMAEIDAEILHA